MTKKIGAAFSLILSVMLFAAPTSDEPITADEIIAAYIETQQAESEMAYLNMSIVRPGQEGIERRLIAAYRADDTESAYLVRMVTPKEIEGVTLLSLQGEKSVGKHYLFLPVIGKARPLASQSRTEPFMGSDFTIQDLMRETPDTQNYIRRKDHSTQGEDCYVIRAYERISENSVYAFRDLYISKEFFDLMRIDYFDWDEIEVKNFFAVDYRSSKVEGETKRPHMAIMTDKETRSTTTLTVIESRLNQLMPMEVFTSESIESWTSEEVHDFIFQHGLTVGNRR